MLPGMKIFMKIMSFIENLSFLTLMKGIISFSLSTKGIFCYFLKIFSPEANFSEIMKYVEALL